MASETVAPTTTTETAADRLGRTLRHAEALSFMPYGEGGEAFRNAREDLQDAYLEALANLVREAREAWTHVQAQHARDGRLMPRAVA
jgi:hypothetical protein